MRGIDDQVCLIHDQYNYVDLTITYVKLVTLHLPRHPHIYPVIQE